MRRYFVLMLGAAILFSVALIPASSAAQSGSASANAAPPDFSGVYYPVQAGRGGGGRRVGAPPAGRRGAVFRIPAAASDVHQHL